MNQSTVIDVNQIRWRHCIDLGNGLVTRGTKNTLEDLRQWKFPHELFSGKTVLDVGACDGCFSFYAEKHGATKVLAIDPYRWTFDDRWSGQAGFKLARKILNSEVEDSTIPLENIEPKTVGEWDIILFLGVFYHLPNPFLVVENLAKCCRDTLVLETHIDQIAQAQPYPFVRFYPNGEINKDKTTYWGPNTLFLDDYLKKIGFKEVNTKLIYRGFRSISYAKKDKNFSSDWGQW